jgi:WD40 repeat protein
MTVAAMAQVQLFIGLSSGQIRGHRLASNLTAPYLTLNFHESAVTCLTLSFDGRMLASGGQDGHLVVWDAPSGQMLRSLAHRGPVMACVMRVLPKFWFPFDIGK